MEAPEREGRNRWGLALLLYSALSLASFYPESLRPWDTVGYVGDSLESVYLLAWNVHQVFHSPLHLFDANMLYPEPRALTFSDHQLLSSLSVAPVVWLTGNPVLAYNVAVALACLLAAMAGRHLGRCLGLDEVGAWTAGALYAFHTYQVNEAPRLQILFHGFLPLALWQLLRLLRTGERRAAWLTALFMLLQALCSNYELLYGCVLLGLVSAAALAARPGPTARRLLPLALAGVVAGALYLPIGLPYVLSARSHGYERELPQGIDLEHYVSTSPTNLIYGPIGAKVRVQQQGPHFVGFVSLALATLALLAWARSREPPEGEALLPPRVWVPAAALLALLFVALSLGKDAVVFGHDLGPGPYRLLYYLVPGFKLMRIPERLSLLAMLFFGLLAGRALSLIHRAGWTLPALALAALVPLEHLSPLPLTQRVPVWSEVPEVYRWLATHPVHAMAEVPTRGEGLVRMESIEMYFSAYHFKPTIQGYVSYPTRLNRLLRRLTDQFPYEVTLQAFRRIGVDTVVVHHGRQQGVDLFHQVQGPSKGVLLPRLLHAAGLDLYEQLPRAVAEGRIARVARLRGGAPGLGESTFDEVYRILEAPADPPAPFPRGRLLRGPRWRYEADGGDPHLAADGRRDTSWRIPGALAGDERFDVLFDRPQLVGGVVLPQEWDTVFPTRFRLDGLTAEGEWKPISRFTRAQALQLLDRLLADPRTAAIGFDFPSRELSGVRLAVDEGGTSFDGWSIPEIEVLAP